MVRRCPDLILVGIAGVLMLRSALWLTTSDRVAHFIVVTLAPAWILSEGALLTGVVLCGRSLALRRKLFFLGQPVGREATVPLFIVGLVTLVLELSLWVYAFEIG